jgi:hypothetical protein
MKKLLGIVATVLMMSSTLVAQITITKDDMPLANKAVVRARANTTGQTNNFTLTGANFSWDFTGLVPTTADTLKYDTITSAPFFTQAIFGAFAGVQNRSQIFGDTKNPLNFPSAVASFFPVDSAKAFYRKATGSFAKTGFSIRLAGFDIPLPYDTADVIYKFPLNFGSIDSSNSAFEINTPLLTALYYRQSQKRVNVVDGWGSLKLPYSGTYDVLRVKSIIGGSDTIHVDTGIVNFGFRIPRLTEVQYKWLAKGQEEPVLTVTGTELAGTFTPSLINFKLGPAPESLTQATKDAMYAVLTASGATLYDAHNISTINVYDMQGKLLYATLNKGNRQVDLHYTNPAHVIIHCITQSGQQVKLKL